MNINMQIQYIPSMYTKFINLLATTVKILFEKKKFDFSFPMNGFFCSFFNVEEEEEEEEEAQSYTYSRIAMA